MASIPSPSLPVPVLICFSPVLAVFGLQKALCSAEVSAVPAATSYSDGAASRAKEREHAGWDAVAARGPRVA